MFLLKMRRGFTLIEMMVVIAIVAMGTAVASLALRDGEANALERDADADGTWASDHYGMLALLRF